MRVLSFYIFLVVSILYYFSVAFLKLLIIPKQSVVHWAATSWGSFMLRHSGVDLKVEGSQNLSKTPAIFVANHQSVLDFFILCALLPLKTTALAKQSLRFVPLLGRFMKIAGIIFVDRKHHDRAIESMQQAKAIIANGYSIAIAVEGTRTHTGRLQPLKKGAFYLAMQTGLPMIPITIKNAYDLLPRHAWAPKPGTVEVFVDAPIDTRTWTEATLPQHVEEVRNIFLSRLQ